MRLPGREARQNAGRLGISRAEYSRPYRNVENGVRGERPDSVSNQSGIHWHDLGSRDGTNARVSGPSASVAKTECDAGILPGPTMLAGCHSN